MKSAKHRPNILFVTHPNDDFTVMKRTSVFTRFTTDRFTLNKLIINDDGLMPEMNYSMPEMNYLTAIYSNVRCHNIHFLAPKLYFLMLS